MNPLTPRVDTDTCVCCRKKLKPGDRVQIAQIVASIGRNQAAGGMMGAYISEEFELAHINCSDVSLSGRVIAP